jgi:hypothetical protein
MKREAEIVLAEHEKRLVAKSSHIQAQAQEFYKQAIQAKQVGDRVASFEYLKQRKRSLQADLTVKKTLHNIRELRNTFTHLEDFKELARVQSQAAFALRALTGGNLQTRMENTSMTLQNALDAMTTAQSTVTPFTADPPEQSSEDDLEKEFAMLDQQQAPEVHASERMSNETVTTPLATTVLTTDQAVAAAAAALPEVELGRLQQRKTAYVQQQPHGAHAAERAPLLSVSRSNVVQSFLQAEASRT